MTQYLNTTLLPSRILLCGLGSIGKRHLRLLRKHWPNLEIAVLRSGYGPACKETELANHIFTNLDDALAWKPKAAIIATPATDHLSKALPLARLEVPLLIEKPVGSGFESSSDWQELIDLSSKVAIEVAYVLRHDPCVTFIKDQLRAGKLGRLIEADFYCGSWLPEWRSGLDYRDTVSARRDKGGGVLLELSHELDLAQYLLGALELNSSLLQKSGLLEINVEDQAIIVGRSLSGCSVTIRLNFCTNPASRHVTIRGSAGEIFWNLIEGKVQMIDTDTLKPQTYLSNITVNDRYLIQMKFFLESAMRSTRPVCSLAEGLMTLELIKKARDGYLFIET